MSQVPQRDEKRLAERLGSTGLDSTAVNNESGTPAAPQELLSIYRITSTSTRGAARTEAV